MSKYMMKYKGIYRLKVPYDLRTGDFPRNSNGNIDSDYDDIYIDCYFKTQIYHYGHGVLRAYIPSKARGNNLKIEIDKIDDLIIMEFFQGDKETLITFKDRNLSKIVHLFKPKTTGAGISPFSVRNLPNRKKKNLYEPYKIKSKELIELKDKMQKLTEQYGAFIYMNLYSYLEKENPDKRFKNQKYSPFSMIEVNDCIVQACTWVENIE